MLEVYETNRLHIGQISEMTGPGGGGRGAEEDWANEVPGGVEEAGQEEAGEDLVQHISRGRWRG